MIKSQEGGLLDRVLAQFVMDVVEVTAHRARLIGTVLAEQHDQWRVVRRYLPALAVHVGEQHRMDASMMLPTGAA